MDDGDLLFLFAPVRRRLTGVQGVVIRNVEALDGLTYSIAPNAVTLCCPAWLWTNHRICPGVHAQHVVAPAPGSGAYAA
jgi:hypothetical protein